MSEQQKHNNFEHLPPPPVPAETIQDLDASRARLSEMASLSFDGVRLAFHGLAGAVRERREGYAKNREDKMDHKDLLYDHMGLEAMGVESDLSEERLDRKGRPVLDAAGSPVIGEPRHRSFAERFMDKRIEKKIFKKDYKEARREFTRNAYGGYSKSHTLGLATKKDTRRRHKDVEKEFKRGDISARELALAKVKIDGTPTKFENPVQRKTRRGVKRSVKRLEGAIDQPVLSRWRARRRYEARNDQTHHHKQQQKHEAKIAEIRTRRGWQDVS